MSTHDRNDAAKWVSFVLFAAAAYNLGWGAWVVTSPRAALGFYDLPGTEPIAYWQCVGMLVGCYGVAYGFAAADPIRFAPLVVVGLIGKLLGPLGAIYAIRAGELPPTILWLNLSNDLIWLAPFSWALWQIHSGRLARVYLGWQTHSGTPYPKALGESFQKLDPDVRRFHSASTETGPIEVRGAFEVRRGPGRLGNWLTDATGFPATSAGLDVSLRILPGVDGEWWDRRFGTRSVRSWQGLRGGHLFERYGPLVLYLEPRVEEGALVVVDLRSTFLGVPLPPFLTPRVYARASDRGGAMLVEVRIAASPLGVLVAYSGYVELQASGGPLDRGGTERPLAAGGATSRS